MTIKDLDYQTIHELTHIQNQALHGSDCCGIFPNPPTARLLCERIRFTLPMTVQKVDVIRTGFRPKCSYARIRKS